MKRIDFIGKVSKMGERRIINIPKKLHGSVNHGKKYKVKLIWGTVNEGVVI